MTNDTATIASKIANLSAGKTLRGTISIISDRVGSYCDVSTQRAIDELVAKNVITMTSYTSTITLVRTQVPYMTVITGNGRTMKQPTHRCAKAA